jgi:K(+)-stimulated pyrophosphate-energized sodium pump
VASREPTHPYAWLKYFLCGVIGVLTSIAFVYITQYYTEYRYRPVREIAEASQTGPATNIIAGIGIGFECVLMPVVAIAIAILASYKLGVWALPGGGLFGTAVATMGMLGTAAYILAMDTFGPITDNAGGIVEMSRQPEEVRKKTDRLDAVGNTTKALTKGYAIGSAALAAFLLFSAYLDELKNYTRLDSELAKPEVFLGRLLGACSSSSPASRSGRRQGGAGHPGRAPSSNPRQRGQAAGLRPPVDSSRAGLKRMIAPGLVAVSLRSPSASSSVLRRRREAVAAFLMVGVAGIVVAF